MRRFRWTVFFALALLPLVTLAVLGVWAISMDRQMVVDSAAKVAEISGNQLARDFSAAFEQSFNEMERTCGKPILFEDAKDPMGSVTGMDQIRFFTAVATIDDQSGMRMTWPPNPLFYPSIPPWTIQLTPQQRLLVSRIPQMSDEEFTDEALSESWSEIPRQIFEIERSLRREGDFSAAIKSSGSLVTASGLGLGDLLCLRSLQEPAINESSSNLFNAIVTHVQLHPSNFSPDILQVLRQVYMDADHLRFLDHLEKIMIFGNQLNTVKWSDLRPGSTFSLPGISRKEIRFFVIASAGQSADPSANIQIKFIMTPGFLADLAQKSLKKALGLNRLDSEFEAGIDLFKSSGHRLEISGDDARVRVSHGAFDQDSALTRIPLDLYSRLSGGGHFLTIYAQDMESLYATHYTRVKIFGGMLAVVILLGIFTLALIYKNHQRLIELNEMQKNFVSSVSHELRAPIASLLLLSEGLKEGRVHPESRRQQYFSLMVNECRRLGGLITNILTFSRMDRGISDSRFHEVNLRCLLEETGDLMAAVAGEHGRSLDWGADDAVPESVVLDESSIRQALINLVDNALKHTPENSGVNIRVQPSKDGNSVEFIVSDQGTGVDPDLRNTIFKPFVRAGSELTRETTGIGIGLAIVQHIATSHNGSIRFRNRTEGGCDFILAIPLNLSEQNI